MSLYIDRKYAMMLSPQLELFKQKKDYEFNFRCPICGDSKKKKTKARGYLYRRQDHFLFKCHNCFRSLTFGQFLKQVDPYLYDQYRVEVYKEANPTNTPEPDYGKLIKRPVFEIKQINLPTIESLSKGHLAREYVALRKIPVDRWKDLYFAEDFKKFIDETFPAHDKKLIEGEPRLILPFYDEKNILQGVQGRALDGSKIRYITIRASEDMKKVFGLDRVDFTKPIYVVEGPIDSLFLKNSVASMDASLYRVIEMVGDYDYVFVHDNEPRNKEILKAMSRSINSGKKVCIWPSNIEAKDINDMVLSGLDPQKIIDEHTYQGLKAKLEFEMWRKA